MTVSFLVGYLIFVSLLYFDLLAVQQVEMLERYKSLQEVYLTLLINLQKSFP